MSDDRAEHDTPATDATGAAGPAAQPATGTAGAEGWAAKRARAIDAHAADLARRTAVDSEKAAGMLREFVATARERGVEPVRLVARSYDGRHRYRTGLRGWYLRPDGGIAVAEDGRYYVLAVPGSLKSLLTGVTLTPSAPRSVLGEGGRDGERVTLRVALDHVLARAS